MAPALRDLPDCALVSVSRKDFSQVESFATEFGARKWVQNWRDLIADDEIDAIYIATPVYLHAEQTVAAAQAGKHVLCEKPMAMNIKECDAMIDAAKANGTFLGIAYYRHFYPVVNRIKEILASGEIGTIVSAQIEACSHYNPLAGEQLHWRLIKEQAGGGPMMDIGCHRIELLINIVGPIVKVSGGVANRLYYDRQIEDTASALFEFEGGAHGYLLTAHSTFESKDTVKIYSTGGSLYVDHLNSGRLRIVSADNDRIEECPNHKNLHEPLIENFTRAVLDGKRPAVCGEIGRDVNVILEKIYQ